MPLVQGCPYILRWYCFWYFFRNAGICIHFTTNIFHTYTASKCPMTNNKLTRIWKKWPWSNRGTSLSRQSASMILTLHSTVHGMTHSYRWGHFDSALRSGLYKGQFLFSLTLSSIVTEPMISSKIGGDNYTIPLFARKDWGSLWKPSVRIAVAPYEIWTRELQY
jgi:hypothetical protein